MLSDWQYGAGLCIVQGTGNEFVECCLIGLGVGNTDCFKLLVGNGGHSYARTISTQIDCLCSVFCNQLLNSCRFTRLGLRTCRERYSLSVAKRRFSGCTTVVD